MIDDSLGIVKCEKKNKIKIIKGGARLYYEVKGHMPLNPWIVAQVWTN